MRAGPRVTGAASAERRGRRLGIALLVVSLLSAGRAAAEDPPPQDSLAALAADTAQALETAARLVPALGIAEATAPPAAACADLAAAAARCPDVDLAPCEGALAALYGRLVALAPTLDTGRAGAAEYTAAALGGLTNRLAVARESVAVGRCRHLALPGAHASRLVVGGDGRTVVVEPATPLRAGRRYALVVDGLPAPALAALRATLVPLPADDGGRPRLVVPSGAFADPLAAGLTDGAGGIRAADAVAVVRGLEREAGAVPGVAPFAGLRFVLPRALTPETLRALRARFVPAGARTGGTTLAVFRTFDARPGLGAYRAAVARAGCAETPAAPADEPALAPPGAPHVAGVFHGEYRSLEMRGGAAGVLGVPAAEAAVVARPFLLALPTGADATAPLVIAVNGHGSRASRMLADHAEGVTARGMALLALELPEHGERAVEGRPFLDPLAPRGLAANLRQSVVDVMGAVHAARRCGILLADGRRLRPRDVRYLGYSLGGMVGAVARAVEADLGPTVLLAPAGDVASWMMLRVAVGLGSGVISCIGGADNGRSCLEERSCPAPGVCVQDPYVARLTAAATLPYRLLMAGSDPLAVAGERAPPASDAPLLVVTGGQDEVLVPLLATRLADAYRLQPVGPHRRRGRRATLVQWPELRHDLATHPGVRAQAYAFLARPSRAPVDSPERAR